MVSICCASINTLDKKIKAQASYKNIAKNRIKWGTELNFLRTK
jgi:hypothetical protein